jgi:hypothetical protein
MQSDFEPLPIYKNGEPITNAASLPVPHRDRISTDVFCTIATSIFAFTMLLIAVTCVDL